MTSCLTMPIFCRSLRVGTGKILMSRICQQSNYSWTHNQYQLVLSTKHVIKDKTGNNECNKCKCHSVKSVRTVTNSSNVTDNTCNTEDDVPSYLFSDSRETLDVLKHHMKVIPDFISEEEEDALFKEVEPHVKRLRYESSHWDDAIHGYRETQRKTWTEKNQQIIQRVRDLAFPPGVAQLALVHVLDLKKDGYIKPHVDAVKFCGNTIAGISLLSSAVMRLVHTDDSSKVADVLLERRSLYIMKDEARYKYTHEVLKDEDSVFKGRRVPRDRRISVICRNEP